MMDMPGTSQNLRFALNGTSVQAEPRTGERLSYTLRERLGSRDVKVGCNAGDCGACTVLIDDAPVCACLTASQQAMGRRVETVAGLMASDPDAQALGQRFLDHGAAQCGICTPGMIVSAVALLREVPAPSERQVEDALGGVLCRCTGYRKIIDAVRGIDPAAPGDGKIGDPVRRLDGTERFGDDIAPMDALVLRIIRSPYDRAGFRFGDLDAWVAATEGVVAVLTADDIPGENRFGVIPPFADQPVFAEQEARFRGEAVAAVVASPEIAVRFDETEFPVTWDERKAVLDMQAACAPGAPLLHVGRADNVMCGGFVKRGDPEAALARADVQVSASFTTGFVEHAYIEPEAGFARMEGDKVEVYACTQAPVMDLEGLEIILGRDRSQIRVVPTGVGGGFGSKLDLSIQPFLALAALKTGQPVRIAYSRTESMQSTTKRHPCEITVRLGANRDGRLCGMHFEGAFNTGAYASWGPTVANRVPVHASGPYLVGDYHAKTAAIHTHLAPSGAFRGFGVPLANQRHSAIFHGLSLHGLTPTQFATLVRLGEVGTCSQNQLGRLTAMDVATIKGVVERLKEKGLAVTNPDPNDRRRMLVSLSGMGATLIPALHDVGKKITGQTLDPLTEAESRTFLRLLAKLT